jgi:hypothetical protein
MYVKAIFAFAVMIATFQPSCAANLIVQGTQDITPVELVLYNFGQRSGKVIACSRGAHARGPMESRPRRRSGQGPALPFYVANPFGLVATFVISN